MSILKNVNLNRPLDYRLQTERRRKKDVMFETLAQAWIKTRRDLV